MPTRKSIDLNTNEKNNNSIYANNNGLNGNHIITNKFNDKNYFNDKNDKISHLNETNGIYTTTNDIYRPYTIFDSDNDKLSQLPASTTGSLSSITTTSIASSDPYPGAGGLDGDDAGDGCLATRNGTVIKQEEWWKTTIQVAVPFFIAGIGTIGAGVILGRVENQVLENGLPAVIMGFSHWDVFVHIPDLFILVPALLGLKGNLDMCLASRLSTQANLGNMSSKREILRMVVGNISLVQVQATVAAFIVALFAIGVGAWLNSRFEWPHAVLLVASSMVTATTSCFVLDFVLVAVIIVSHKIKMNPDNLATPLAASIGDVVSLSILAMVASMIFEILYTRFYVPFIIIGVYFILLPMWVTIVLYNKYTRPVLKSGWVPVLSALFISGLGGLVLDAAVGTFHGFVVFQPIINGIAGNLVSVQASKISTMLHQSSILGIVPPFTKIFEAPWRALIHGVPYAKTARILVLMSIPGQVLFIFAADFIHMGESTIQAPFVFSYLTVSLLLICGLLYTAHVIIHAMWRWKIDPDNSAIPYLTALGDLFGSSLLLLAFMFLREIGHEYGIDEGLIDENIALDNVDLL